MKSLIALQLDNVLAYPFIDPSLNLLFSALMVWEKVELIWGEGDLQIQKFRDSAFATPILFDKGLIALKEPKAREITAASEELKRLSPDYLDEIANDDGFADQFVINPIKIANQYWEIARRRGDDSIEVPRNVGRLYLGLLATEMAKRPSDLVPLLSNRIEEPLFLEGGINESPKKISPDECITMASFDCLATRKNLNRLSWRDIEKLAEDILDLRNLDSWYSWRNSLFSFRQNLNGASDPSGIQAVTRELNDKVRKFKEDAKRQNMLLGGKVSISILGGIIGFFIGSLPGAMLGASIGGTTAVLDVYQAHYDRKERMQSTEQFIIEAKRIVSKY